MRSVLTCLTLLIVLGRGSAYEGPQRQAGSTEPNVSTLRVTSRLVLVDVIASDSQGRPIPDLKPADFTLFEDGRPQ